MSSQQIELFSSVYGNTFPSDSSPLKKCAYLISIGVIYLLLVKVSTLFFIVPGANISAFWPLNGVFASFLLMSPRYLWKYILIVVFIANILGNLISENTLSLSIGFGLANVIEGWLIAYLSLIWSKPNCAFSSFRGLIKFLLLVSLSTFAGAIIGALNLGFEFGFNHFFLFLSTWFSADVLGSLLILSVIFSWNDKQLSFSTLNLTQAVSAVLLLISTIILSILIHAQQGENELIPLNYMVFPLLIWAAVQFKVKGASLTVFIIAILAHWYTINGRGAFVIYGIDIQDQMFWLQCYLVIVFFTAISLALAFSERDSILDNLKINKMLVDEAPKSVVVCRLEILEDKHSFLIVAVNKSAANLAHDSVDNLLGQCLTDSFFGPVNVDYLTDYQNWVLASQGDASLPDLVVETEENSGATVYKRDAMFVGKNCVALFYEDITESKQVEQFQRQSAKLEALGTLASGISHDFNNVLGLISGYTEMGIATSSPNSKERDYFNQISRAGERASLLVKKILTFSRMENVNLHPINIRKIVESALEMVSPAISKNIEIQDNIYPHNLLVLADEVDIQQIILNLCINASHAFQDEAGVIKITLDKHLVDGHQNKSKDLAEKQYLKLQIADTGQGISSEILEKIFDPFFTTKGAGKGTGLGLSIVYGIMLQCGGKITVESKLGKGTVFTLLFPIENKKINDDCVDLLIGYSTSAKMKGHILVVDDEPLLLELYTSFLEGEGLTVTACSDGKEALKLYVQQPNKFDVVFTDNEMPTMTGKQLCQTIKSINKHQPIIFATGYGSKKLEEGLISLGGVEFFLKPIILTRLVEIISELIVENKN